MTRINPCILSVGLLTVIIVVLQGFPAASRIYIDVDSALQRKIPIAIPQFLPDTGEARLGSHLAETLGDALAFSGLFEVLDPAMFLQEPGQMGLELAEVKFAEWKFLGADLLVRGSYRTTADRLQVTLRLFDVIQQRLIFKKTYEGVPAHARQMMLQSADEVFLHLTGEPGIFQTRIAFVGDATGSKEIYIADFDGSNIRRLTRDTSLNLGPAWSPDGKEISYVSYKKDNPNLYSLNVITGAARLISSRPGLNIAPAWHPQGGKVAVTLTMNGNPEIYLLDARGEILRQLTVSWAIDVSPCWSPDGRRLAYVSNRAGKPQIYVLDVQSGKSRRLTFEGDYNTSPAWSPRGDQIVYAGFHNGNFDLFLINADGTGLRQLTGGSGNNENPSWSADGRLILFQSDRHGSPTLWVMLANGGEQRRVPVDLDGAHTEPAWSPRLTWTAP